LSKGSGIFVEGSLRTSSYEKDGEKRYRTEIVANNIILTGGRGGRSDAPRDDDYGHGQAPARQERGGYAPRGGGAPARAPAAPAADTGFDDYGGGGFDGDDEIPF
jgi:single-strand DNA-binding protein